MTATAQGTSAAEIIAALSPTFGRPGLKTRRAIGASEVAACVMLTEHAASRVRCYSSAGFVPNSYRGRCDIQYVEATKDDDGEWTYSTGWASASRSYGNGSLSVVDGRGI